MGTTGLGTERKGERIESEGSIPVSAFPVVDESKGSVPGLDESQGSVLGR